MRGHAATPSSDMRGWALRFLIAPANFSASLVKPTALVPEVVKIATRSPGCSASRTKRSAATRAWLISVIEKQRHVSRLGGGLHRGRGSVRWRAISAGRDRGWRPGSESLHGKGGDLPRLSIVEDLEINLRQP